VIIVTGNENLVASPCRDIDGAYQFAFTFYLKAAEKSALYIKDLYPIVSRIGDINTPVCPCIDPYRATKLSWSFPFTTNRILVFTSMIKYNDTVIPTIDNIYVQLVNSYIARQGQRARSTACDGLYEFNVVGIDGISCLRCEKRPSEYEQG
jgi:hypothetical protein